MKELSETGYEQAAFTIEHTIDHDQNSLPRTESIASEQSGQKETEQHPWNVSEGTIAFAGPQSNDLAKQSDWRGIFPENVSVREVAREISKSGGILSIYGQVISPSEQVTKLGIDRAIWLINDGPGTGWRKKPTKQLPLPPTHK